MAETTAPAPGQMQCQLTGEWLPEDQTIILRGLRVSAEGKQELLERLLAGDPLPGESLKPTFGKRFGALFIDNLLIFIPIWILGLVVSAQMSTATDAGLMQTAISIFGIAVCFLYTVVLHAKYGQTLGKRATGIKVVMLNGSPISMRTSIKRSLIFYGPQVIGPILTVTLIDYEMIGVTLTGLGSLFYFADCIVTLADRQQRSIHDQLAGTKVILHLT
ncbi:MAG: RDD family protein [Phycisphaeraceae bacterium]|nr:RDD family protein [Phycisphaeraceae bacterium]